METLKYKSRWAARFGHLPNPETFIDALLTPEEAAATLKVKVSTVVGGYINRPVAPLKPDAYAEGPNKEWNQIYFLPSTIDAFGHKKRERIHTSRIAFTTDEGYRRRGAYA